MEVTLERVPQYEVEDEDMGGRERMGGSAKMDRVGSMLCPMRWKAGKKEAEMAVNGPVRRPG